MIIIEKEENYWLKVYGKDVIETFTREATAIDFTRDDCNDEELYYFQR